MLHAVSTPVETIERAIVFEQVVGARRLGAEHCITEFVSQFDYALLQVDLGLHEAQRTLFVILRLREDRFTDTSHARIVASAQAAHGRVVALSELEYQERGLFLTGFNACTQQRLGVEPEQVPALLTTLLLEQPTTRRDERRATPRRLVNAPAVLKVGAKKVDATVADLSQGGALVRAAAPPVVAEKVELEVQLPEGSLHAQATVVNVSARGAGVQFTSPLPSDVRQPERVGPYELLSLLGQGGTGEVHFARVVEGPRAGEHVALKRLHKRRAQDPVAVAQFAAEAKTLSLLKHPHIVRTLEAGEFEGQQYLVMEAIDGRDLSQVLRRCRARKKPLPVEVACFAVKTLLEALHAVHTAKDERGEPLELVHGDVSPHNLYVSKAGVLKLGDFGLAKRAGVGVAHRVEQGRPTYVSPELLQGNLAPSADLWAAAVTLYELLTLEQPFSGNTLEALTHAIGHTREKPVRQLREDCSGPLEAVLKTALEKNPAHRFQSARAFADALAPHYHPVRGPRQLPTAIAELFASPA